MHLSSVTVPAVSFQNFLSHPLNQDELIKEFSSNAIDVVIKANYDDFSEQDNHGQLYYLTDFIVKDDRFSSSSYFPVGVSGNSIFIRFRGTFVP